MIFIVYVSTHSRGLHAFSKKGNEKEKQNQLELQMAHGWKHIAMIVCMVDLTLVSQCKTWDETAKSNVPERNNKR